MTDILCAKTLKNSVWKFRIYEQKRPEVSVKMNDVSYLPRGNTSNANTTISEDINNCTGVTCTSCSGVTEQIIQSQIAGTDYLDKPLILTFLLVFVVTSITGNIAVIYVINSDKTLRRAPFHYLLCISVMDLFKTIFCLPFVIEVVLNNFKWEYKDETCVALAFETAFYTTSTAFGIVAIAIDRYLSITASRTYKTCLKNVWNRVVIATGCGVSFCISFPPVFEKNTYKFVPQEMQCTLYHQPYRDNKTLGYTTIFVLMLVLTLFLYCRLLLFMRSHRRMAPLQHEPARSSDWTFFGPGANGQALVNLLNGFANPMANPVGVNNRNIQHNVGRLVNLRVVKEGHETRLFFVISASFIALWTPYLFQTFAKVFNSDIVLSPVFITVSTILSYAHVAVSPLVCLVLKNPLRSFLVSKIKSLCIRHSYSGVATDVRNCPETNLPHIDLPT